MPTTVATPGSIVVPLSQIIDKLQGKLSSSEIDKLLYDILSKRKDQVGPGDLITADLVNQILADLHRWRHCREAAVGPRKTAGRLSHCTMPGRPTVHW
jgi:hypothetical protein